MLLGSSGEARDAAKHPAVHPTDPTTKTYLAQHDNPVEVEKPRVKL